MNKTILIGRLTKDPELKYTTSNTSYVQFTVAVNRPFTNQAGEREADFIPCIVWREQAENLAKYQTKGNQVAVEGRIEVRSYDDKDGTKRYSTQVVCDTVQYLDSKKETQTIVEKPRVQDINPFKDAPKIEKIGDDSLPF